MTLYHGSYKSIEKPDLSFSRLLTDFGRGFYLTPLKAQAEIWAQRFLREHGTAIISCYEFLPNPCDGDEGSGSTPDIKTLAFDAYSLEWLNFITACRLGQAPPADPDLIIGGVANDKVFDTLQLYFDNLIGAEEAIGRLRYNKPNLQYCFKNQSIIDWCLKYTGNEAVK